MTPSPVRVTFPGSFGDELAARLDLPASPIRGPRGKTRQLRYCGLPTGAHRQWLTMPHQYAV